ncbi:uncharacterized protein [Branchiostoma lanceolatum]|uniref:uncharacterized protein n=1 Tax=Branchiostoma lanceolatum TaxID=7740 RepID=UPI00345291DE
MTGPLYDCTESKTTYMLTVWRFAFTVGIACTVFGLVCINATDGVEIRELTDKEFFTVHEKSNRRENTAQEFVATSRKSDGQIETIKENSEDRTMHESSLFKDEPIQRCKRSTDDSGAKGLDTAVDDNKKDVMSTPARSLVTSEATPKESLTEEAHYCPFFNNRAPSAQPNLRNCSWYQPRSCCLQREIDIIFRATYPLSAASDECRKQLSFLYCYVCDPAQNTFYSYETLTVCETFCDRIFAACGSALWKGSSMKSVYSSGRDFCLRRSFRVGSVSKGRCFHHEEEVVVSGIGQRTRPSTSVIILALGLKLGRIR